MRLALFFNAFAIRFSSYRINRSAQIIEFTPMVELLFPIPEKLIQVNKKVNWKQI